MTLSLPAGTPNLMGASFGIRFPPENFILLTNEVEWGEAIPSSRAAMWEFGKGFITGAASSPTIWPSGSSTVGRLRLMPLKRSSDVISTIRGVTEITTDGFNLIKLADVTETVHVFTQPKPKISHIAVRDGFIELEISSASAKYQVEVSTDFLVWENFEEGLRSNNIIRFSPPAAANNFFRLRLN